MYELCQKGEVKRLVIVGLFLLDLVFKYLAVSGDYAVINRGVSFGVIIGSEIIYYILISILMIWLIRERLWLIVAGAVANVVSRIVYGGVVDYWNFFGLFTNNLADWMIVGGAGGYFYKESTKFHRKPLLRTP